MASLSCMSTAKTAAATINEPFSIRSVAQSEIDRVFSERNNRDRFSAGNVSATVVNVEPGRYASEDNIRLNLISTLRYQARTNAKLLAEMARVDGEHYKGMSELKARVKDTQDKTNANIGTLTESVHAMCLRTIREHSAATRNALQTTVDGHDRNLQVLNRPADMGRHAKDAFAFLGRESHAVNEARFRTAIARMTLQTGALFGEPNATPDISSRLERLAYVSAYNTGHVLKQSYNLERSMLQISTQLAHMGMNLYAELRRQQAGLNQITGSVSGNATMAELQEHLEELHATVAGYATTANANAVEYDQEFAKFDEKLEQQGAQLNTIQTALVRFETRLAAIEQAAAPNVQAAVDRDQAQTAAHDELVESQNSLRTDYSNLTANLDATVSTALARFTEAYELRLEKLEQENFHLKQERAAGDHQDLPASAVMAEAGPSSSNASIHTNNHVTAPPRCMEAMK